jgi:hypothetical protein
MSAPKDEKKYWLDNPKNVDKIFWGLALICALTVIADLFYHKHAIYHVESYIGFHAAYGFVSCWFLVLAAKVLRKILKRDEDYYD